MAQDPKSLEGDLEGDQAQERPGASARWAIPRVLQGVLQELLVLTEPQAARAGAGEIVVAAAPPVQHESNWWSSTTWLCIMVAVAVNVAFWLAMKSDGSSSPTTPSTHDAQSESQQLQASTASTRTPEVADTVRSRSARVSTHMVLGGLLQAELKVILGAHRLKLTGNKREQIDRMIFADLVLGDGVYARVLEVASRAALHGIVRTPRKADLMAYGRLTEWCELMEKACDACEEIPS